MPGYFSHPTPTLSDSRLPLVPIYTHGVEESRYDSRTRTWEHVSESRTSYPGPILLPKSTFPRASGRFPVPLVTGALVTTLVQCINIGTLRIRACNTCCHGNACTHHNGLWCVFVNFSLVSVFRQTQQALWKVSAAGRKKRWKKKVTLNTTTRLFY